MNNKFDRRDFLRSLVGASTTGALGVTGQLALMREAAAMAPAFNDYKALVCIFLYGGNDSFNMLIPNGTDNKSGYSNYQSIRGGLAVGNTNLDLNTVNSYNVDGTEESAYRSGVHSLSSKGIDLGFNAVMPELAKLTQANKVSIIANIGNLVKPVTREQVKNETADLPLFLFSHKHQQRALQTGQGNNLNDIGWAGRIADNWGGVNSNSLLGLNISYAGSDRMLIGNNSTPMSIKAGDPPRYSDLRLNTNANTDRRSLFRALAGFQNISATGDVNFAGGNTFSSADPFKNFYGKSVNKSLQAFELLYDAWDRHTISYTNKDTYGNDLFSVPSAAELGFSNDIGGGLISELEAVAKMIDIGAQNAFSTPLGAAHNRQVFMVKLGGFDTHSGQISKHPLLLRELSLALGKFQTALDELGHANKVTTFTMSDFGRTMSNNGDGTDHAWGSHQMVIGGDGQKGSGNLNGGTMLGTSPDLTLDGADDFSSKGRIIPTLAQDQLNATICKWFGVDDELMPLIFPNLSNFETALTPPYLDNLFVG